MENDKKPSEATEVKQSAPVAEQPKPVKSTITLPTSKELLKAGVQFGHETKRWDPKMRKYIFGSKNDIHIIDVAKTEENLKSAVDFLTEASSRGKVLFIGTKNQAADIVREEAIKAGGFFIDARWAGGLLTNFSVVKKSLDRLNLLEKQLAEEKLKVIAYEKLIEIAEREEGISIIKKDAAKQLKSLDKTILGA